MVTSSDSGCVSAGGVGGCLEAVDLDLEAGCGDVCAGEEGERVDWGVEAEVGVAGTGVAVSRIRSRQGGNWCVEGFVQRAAV